MHVTRDAPSNPPSPSVGKHWLTYNAYCVCVCCYDHELTNNIDGAVTPATLGAEARKVDDYNRQGRLECACMARQERYIQGAIDEYYDAQIAE